MELSFHSKEADEGTSNQSASHYPQEVSYEEESSVSELITQLKKPAQATNLSKEGLSGSAVPVSQ